MALPVIRSFNSLLKQMLQTYLVKSGVTDVAKGSANRSIIETAAISDFKIQGDIMSALASVDIDNASNADLDRIGFKAGVARLQARESNGTVTIYQQALIKIATKIYQGTAAPPAGSTTLNIADVNNFPTSGAVYIGRGTNNLEGPIPYTSYVSLGSYYQLNLSSPTTKNHNLGETVILAQGGNRIIQAGSLVQTRSTLTSNSVTFRTINSVTLLDGEIQISGVPVVCTQVGSIGNITANAIVEFASSPFPNAAATNPLAYVSGRDVMSDPDYRDLIKKTEQSKVRGTDLAIKQASVGVQSTDDNQTVTSAEIRKPASRQEPSMLFLDNSAGYQPIFSGQGFEQIIDNANGGEKYIQLQKQDITKALVTTTLDAPFALTGDMKLAVRIGGVLSQHTFASSDFATEGTADTFEVVNSINNNPNLTFNAIAIDNNKHIALFAKAFSNEDVEVTVPGSDTDANDFLGFPRSQVYSLRLYKNDKILVKDGIIPTLYSNPQNIWNNSISNGATLKIKLDKTSFQTITINDTDFVAYGYSTVNKNNSLDSWASVLNDKIAGATVSVEGNTLKIVSNKGADNSAYIEISTDLLLNSLAQGDNMWEPDSMSGVKSDYSFNRSTGQVQLNTVAASGDVLTAGSRYTRGFIDSAVFTGGSLTLGSSPVPRLYFIADADASLIGTSISNTVSVSITNPSSNTWRYTFSVVGVLSNVQKDDLVIVTDNSSISANNAGVWRVNAVGGAGTWFEIVKTVGTIEGPIALTGGNDLIFIRSPEGEIQSVTLPTGLQTLTAIANTIKTLPGLSAEVIGGKKIRVSTLSFDENVGKIFLAGQNTNAGALGFGIGSSGSSNISHTAFNTSQTDMTFIEMFHDSFATGDNTSPYTSVVTTTDLDAAGFEPNYEVAFLNPYGSNIVSNRKIYTGTDNVISTNLTLRDSAKLHEIIANDRYYLGVPFNFNALDNIVAVLDGDTVNKTFNIRLGRKASVYNSPNASTLKAYDADFGPTANFPSGFGNNFDFADFKIHFKARTIIDPVGSNNKMIIRSAQFGPTGNQLKVGIYYPQSESSAISHAATTGSMTDMKLYLASGSLRTGGTWDATTQFDVTNPVGNTWRYTFNGTGTAPQFLAAGILIGDIVNISSNSTFAAANQGTFKVTNLTNTYFEVTNYTPGTAEINKNLSVANSLKFFPLDSSANQATLLGTYVNGNSQASSYISIAQLEAGTGVISGSTLDETSGVQSSYTLQDGENWILSSSIGTTITPTNDFTLKRPLSIFGADLLNEQFYLVPTRTEHLNRFLNRFAVTGLSSLGNITQASDAKSLEIYSSLFGSSGSVFITGGSGNAVAAAIVESASIIESNYLKFGISKSAASGFHKNQWVQVANSDVSAKETDLTSSVQVTWTAQSPLPNQTTITLPNSTNSNIYQNGYFWTQRYHDSTSSTQMRVEKQGPFVAMSWTGIGTNPNFTKTFSINNIARTAGVSTITLSAVHNVPVGNSIELTVSSVPDSTFNGIFRCTAISTTALSYIQSSQPNVSSTPSSGSAVRKIRKTDRLKVAGNFSVANQGEFVIAGVYNNTVYFTNDNVTEEDVTLSANSDLVFFDYDSVRPGDIFSVGTSILNSTLPFESHQGDYTVVGLGATENSIIISSLSTQTVSSVTLGSDYNTVRCIEAEPFKMYTKIQNIATSPANGNNTDVIVLGTELPSKITPSLGTNITSVSKLEFDSFVKTGEDSYKYYGGLISAVGQKIRGKPSDPVSYPGYAATGSFIEINAALPKRIQLSIVVRNRTGTPFSVVKSRVQSAVSAYVGSVGVGQPVIFSEIVVAAQSIDGVQAVAISSPTYNATNDQIISQPDEKPLIVSIDSDIIVSQAT